VQRRQATASPDFAPIARRVPHFEGPASVPDADSRHYRSRACASEPTNSCPMTMAPKPAGKLPLCATVNGHSAGFRRLATILVASVSPARRMRGKTRREPGIILGWVCGHESDTRR
jgi:hypothetical protein